MSLQMPYDVKTIPVSVFIVEHTNVDKPVFAEPSREGSTEQDSNLRSHRVNQIPTSSCASCLRFETEADLSLPNVNTWLRFETNADHNLLNCRS
ncbi:hypothetical protein CEXT_705781 [Caerostris extrusa]|uniref:Uncharacterized protein n=1 Tax=Caerostris extrusa TaxID=172846 RepID=A0AAV4SGK7_CAEEX|nr:hypothetical protein CEXT_705781 [Caerostris extrusa]